MLNYSYNYRGVVFVVITVGLLLASSLAVARQSTTDPALEIIARINEWRISEDLWPLKSNETLTQLAQLQAEFLLEQDLSSTTDWHAGRQGENPRQRSQFDPYNWPTYNNPLQIAIGENAALGSVRSAISFWKNSQIHRNTALNTGYREIGVAAMRKGTQIIFITVFGSRPNVLPALADVEADRLYLTSEHYRFAPGDRIQRPVQAKLFDADGRPLTDWLDWEPVIPIPEGAGGAITVLYTDGTHETVATVDLSRDRVILPGSIPTPTPTLAPSNTATPEKSESQFLVATNTPESGDVPVGTTAARPSNTPTLKPSATFTPSATRTPTPTGPDLLVVYDNRSLTLLNASENRIDLQNLQLVGVGQTLEITRWTRFADVPLGSFPSGTCLQAYSWSETPAPEAPDDCRLRWSVLTISPDRLFWTQADFEVRRNGTLLATCRINANTCEVELP